MCIGSRVCLCLKLHIDLHMSFTFFFKHFEKENHKLVLTELSSYVYLSCLFSMNNKISKKTGKKSLLEYVLLISGSAMLFPPIFSS